MSRREDAATAAAGTSGVVGGALLRERALRRHYGEAARPRFGAEMGLLKKPLGRKTYVAGALLAGASVTPAISGTRRLFRDDRRFAKSDSLLSEGAHGYAGALREKRRNVAQAPPTLNAMNYGASVGATAGGAGLAHLAMRNRKVPRSAKSAVAAVGGIALGASTLGVQNRIINRASRGQYEVTSTGVRRAKTAAKRPSSKATRVPNGMDPRAERELYGVGKAIRVIRTDGPRYPMRSLKGARGFVQARRSSPPISEREVREAYERAGFVNSAGKKRKLGRDEVHDALHPTESGIGAGALFGGRYPRPTNRISKKLLSTKDIGRAIDFVEHNSIVGGEARGYGRAQFHQGRQHGSIDGKPVTPNDAHKPLFHGLDRKKWAKERNQIVREQALHGVRRLRNTALVTGVVGGAAVGGGAVYAVKKKDAYYGQSMSRGQKQAAVLAAGGPPVIGDFTAAAAAGHMAPPGLKAKTAAYQYGGSNAGQVAGAAAGGYGAAYLARKVPGVGRKAELAQDWADKQKARIPAKVRNATSGAGVKARALKEVEETRHGARLIATGRKAIHPMFGHGKAVGAAAALGIAGGQALGQAGGGAVAYNHALNLEAKHNAKIRKNSVSARRGVSKKGAPDTGMSMAEHKRQAQRKRRQAHISMFTGTTGLGALTATALGSKAIPAPRKVKAIARAAQTPLLTAGAGVGGYGSFNFARTQLREAEAEHRMGMSKAFLSPRTGMMVRRAPSIRRGYIRQTRMGMAPKASYVRGGLG